MTHLVKKEASFHCLPFEYDSLNQLDNSERQFEVKSKPSLIFPFFPAEQMASDSPDVLQGISRVSERNPALELSRRMVRVYGQFVSAEPQMCSQKQLLPTKTLSLT